MGWKKVFLGCFGIRKKLPHAESIVDELSPELSHDNNRGLLPKPKSGCRGIFVIADDGAVNELAHSSMSFSSETLPAGVECYSSTCKNFEGMTDEDAAFIEENRTMFWETYGPKLSAMAPDNSSSEATTDDSSTFSLDTVIEATSMTAAYSPELSTGITELGTSGSVRTLDRKPRALHDRQLCGESPKSQRALSLCGQNGSIQRCIGNEPVSSRCSVRPIHIAAAAVKEDDHALSKLPNTTSQLPDVHKVIVPSLTGNPDEFWQLLRALTGQLGPMLNPAGPKVTRPHNWETDGCICRYLFPSMNSEELIDLSSRYTIQQ